MASENNVKFYCIQEFKQQGGVVATVH